MENDYLSTSAIILKSQDYKENDQLLTIYTRQVGKMRVLAKGIKKNNSKMKGALQVFGLANLTIAANYTLPVVIHAENAKNFDAVYQNLDVMSAVAVCAEFLDKTIIEQEKDEIIFDFMIKAIVRIAHADPWIGMNTCLFKLLRYMGYGNQQDICCICGKKLTSHEIVYGMREGIACTECATDQRCALSVEARTILQRILLQEDKLESVYVSQRAKTQIDAYLDMQIENVISQPLQSRNFQKSLDKRGDK